MYDELIKRLRYLAKVYSICNNENTNEYRLAIEAADAIEELSKRVPHVPHGRLIDADAYESLLRGLGDRNYRRGKGTICDAIKFLHPHYAPTIIPAEEDE